MTDHEQFRHLGRTDEGSPQPAPRPEFGEAKPLHLQRIDGDAATAPPGQPARSRPLGVAAAPAFASGPAPRRRWRSERLQSLIAALLAFLLLGSLAALALIGSGGLPGSPPVPPRAPLAQNMDVAPVQVPPSGPAPPGAGQEQPGTGAPVTEPGVAIGSDLGAAASAGGAGQVETQEQDQGKGGKGGGKDGGGQDEVVVGGDQVGVSPGGEQVGGGQGPGDEVNDDAGAGGRGKLSVKGKEVGHDKAKGHEPGQGKAKAVGHDKGKGHGTGKGKEHEGDPKPVNEATAVGTPGNGLALGHDKAKGKGHDEPH